MTKTRAWCCEDGKTGKTGQDGTRREDGIALHNALHSALHSACGSASAHRNSSALPVKSEVLSPGAA